MMAYNVLLQYFAAVGVGLMAFLLMPPGWISRCRCGIDALPVIPTYPIVELMPTCAPACIPLAIPLKCPYRLTYPLLCLMSTALP